MRIRSFLFCFLLGVYVLLVIPFAGYMNSRPIAVRLGYMPEAKVLKIAFADYRQLLAQHAVVRVLFYFGTLLDSSKRNVQLTPEYFHMFTTLQQAVRLDPYNLDAYYFTQTAFTWELRKIKEVNDMLDHGMEYRIWDAQLPFYAGFNAAYFLKDFSAASRYMKMAAERSGDPLVTNLAARYFHEAGQTKTGLAFIGLMEKNAADPRVKKLYRLRREALQGVQRIEEALQQFQRSHSRTPVALDELVTAGYLEKLPVDPYGGRFFLTPEGGVRSTSKFAITYDNQKTGAN